MSDFKILRCDAAGRKYLGWAKRRLRALSALRTDLNLPAMTKPFKLPDGTLIVLKASEWVNTIYISGGSLATGRINFENSPSQIMPVLFNARGLLEDTWGVFGAVSGGGYVSPNGRVAASYYDLGGTTGASMQYGDEFGFQVVADLEPITAQAKTSDAAFHCGTHDMQVYNAMGGKQSGTATGHGVSAFGLSYDGMTLWDAGVDPDDPPTVYTDVSTTTTPNFQVADDGSSLMDTLLDEVNSRCVTGSFIWATAGSGFDVDLVLGSDTIESLHNLTRVEGVRCRWSDRPTVLVAMLYVSRFTSGAPSSDTVEFGEWRAIYQYQGGSWVKVKEMSVPNIYSTLHAPGNDFLSSGAGVSGDWASSWRNTGTLHVLDARGGPYFLEVQPEWTSGYSPSFVASGSGGLRRVYVDGELKAVMPQIAVSTAKARVLAATTDSFVVDENSTSQPAYWATADDYLDLGTGVGGYDQFTAASHVALSPDGTWLWVGRRDVSASPSTTRRIWRNMVELGDFTTEPTPVSPTHDAPPARGFFWIRRFHGWSHEHANQFKCEVATHYEGGAWQYATVRLKWDTAGADFAIAKVYDATAVPIQPNVWGPSSLGDTSAADLVQSDLLFPLPVV